MHILLAVRTAIFIVLIHELVIADAVVFIAAETMQQICNTKDKVLLSLVWEICYLLVVLHMWMYQMKYMHHYIDVNSEMHGHSYS